MLDDENRLSSCVPLRARDVTQQVDEKANGPIAGM